MKASLVLLFLFQIIALNGQTISDKLEKLSHAKTRVAIEELRTLIALPNDATNQADIQKNAVWLEEAFRKRKFEVQILPTSNTPLVFAERKLAGAKTTVLFYFHYDGQAVDPSKWFQANPYAVVLNLKKVSQFGRHHPHETGRWKNI